MIREERPILLEGEQASLREFTERLANWIEAPEGRCMHRVAGIYGPRGSGKTSVLMTVLSVLRERASRAEAKAEQAQVILPNGDGREDARSLWRALFAPSETRDSDDLLFLLLQYLDDRYHHEGEASDGFQQAREAEVRRKDIDRFLRYEQDISPSSKEIPNRLVAVHNQAAGTTAELRKAFDDIVNGCRREGETLVLLIDDLDLQPHRALELLEILNLFLRQRGVTVLVTADRDLLLHSIDARRSGRHYPGLAAALLAKYVPHAWPLPMPSEVERMAVLWPPPPDESDAEETGGELTDSEDRPLLPDWWPDDRGLVDEVLGRKDLQPHSRTFAARRRALANHYIGRLLPRTYRDLKALHNLLDTLRSRLAKPGMGQVVPARETRSRLAPLGLDEVWLPSVLAMMAALDVQYPQAAVLTWMLDEARRLGAAVDELASREPLGDDPSNGDLVGDEDTHMPEPGYTLPERVRARLEPPYVDEIEQIHARDQVLHLLRTIRALRDRTARTAPREARFLAVSLNANAMAMAEDVWRENGFSEEEVAAWHIDLRDQVDDPDRVTAAEIERAYNRARELLRERGVLDFPHPVWLHIKARLSLAVGLGWTLRYLSGVTACNLFGAETAYFEAPFERIAFRNPSRYPRLEPEPQPSIADTFEQAVVLIDMIGRSRPGSLEEFQLDEEVTVPIEHRYRLSAAPGTRIEQDDVVPMLEDAVELLGHLRQYNGVQHFHLAFIGPDFMAFFLGRQLNAMGRFTLYDRWDNHYEPVFTIDTHG